MLIDAMLSIIEILKDLGDITQLSMHEDMLEATVITADGETVKTYIIQKDAE